MFSHSVSGGFDRKVALHWFMLSFLAGSVNAGGFLSCERFVTHTTGFATLSGIDFAKAEWSKGMSMITVPAFFLGGVMLAAWLTASPKSRGREPNYALVMGLEAVLLLLAALGGVLNRFGDFGESFRVGPDYFLLALLCLASGLQNAAITSSSGATVRTTHLTGLTTDFGIGLTEMLIRFRDRKFRKDMAQKNSVRVGTILSFLGGSFVGALLFLRVGYLGFLLPSGLAGYASIVAFKDSRRKS